MLTQALITAYTAWETCFNSPCIMANGQKAKVGSLACPRDLPLGTVVNIDGVGFVCSDRYNKRLERRFDMFKGYTKNDYENAIKFGKVNKLIYIYDK